MCIVNLACHVRYGPNCIGIEVDEELIIADFSLQEHHSAASDRHPLQNLRFLEDELLDTEIYCLFGQRKALREGEAPVALQGKAGS